MSDWVYQISEVARYFAEKGCKQTAKEIVRICNELQNRRFDEEEFPDRVIAVQSTLQTEFIESLPFGQEFRERCFEEVHNIIFGYVIEDFSLISRFLKRIDEIDKTIVPVAELFQILSEKSPKTEKDRIVMFHLFAYVYLIGVEGIFPELARILYFFAVATEDHVTSYEELEDKDPRKIRKKLKKKLGGSPVFLENWEEKVGLRNAIAHAQAKYDPMKDEIGYFYFHRRKDCSKEKISRIISIEAFRGIHMEIIDTLDAFRYLM